MIALTILHPCISVADMQEALAFFQGLLGLDLVVDSFFDPDELGPLLDLDSPDCRVAVLRCPDGSEIELMEFRQPRGDSPVRRPPQDAGINVLTFIVTELDALVGRLREHGYRSKGPIVDFAGEDRDLRAIHFSGPSGIPLTLGEWSPHPPPA